MVRRRKAKAKAKSRAKAKAKATAKVAGASLAPWAARNDRGTARRAAVKAPNELAEEVGVNTVVLKAKAARVHAYHTVGPKCSHSSFQALECAGDEPRFWRRRRRNRRRVWGERASRRIVGVGR